MDGPPFFFYAAIKTQASIGFDVVVPHHFGPNVHLVFNEAFGTLHTAPDNVNALRVQFGSDLWVLQRFVELLVHPLHNLGGGFGRSQHRPPSWRLKAWEAIFCNGGDIGQIGRTL